MNKYEVETLKNGDISIKIEKDNRAMMTFKATGARWNAAKKIWTCPADKYPEVEKQLAQIGYKVEHKPIDVHIIKSETMYETQSKKDDKIIECIKSCDGYVWMYEQKRWCIPCDQLETLILMLEKAGKTFKIHECENNETEQAQESNKRKFSDDDKPKLFSLNFYVNWNALDQYIGEQIEKRMKKKDDQSDEQKENQNE